MQNPRQNLNQIRSMLDAVGSMALSKVRQLGRGVAEKTLAFLEEPWYQFGRDIGKVVGQILFEVILALASEAIANVVKEALAVVSRLTARLVTGAMDLIRSAGRLVGEAFEWIGRLGSKLAGEMGEMFESVRTFLSKLRALLMELGEDAALADTGIGERMPIPGAKPPVLESRALKPPVRTSPAKVSDLTPPKIHASNIPKEAPVPKREPFANDPDFHQGIKEMEDVPGTTNSEPLKDPLTTEPLEPRTRKQAGVSLEEDHHIASRYVKKNKPIFENAGVHIDDDLNLIKDFPEHGQLRGWYDWQNRSYRFNMRGHHPQYNSWITDTLTKAAPPGLPPDQALQRILQANQKLESIIRQYPEVLSHGPGILPKHLQNLTF